MEYILYYILFFVLGSVFTFLFVLQKHKNEQLKFEKEKERIISGLKEELGLLEKDKSVLESKIIELKEEISVLEKDLEEERKKRENAEVVIATLEAEKKNLMKEIEELEKWKEKFEEEQKLRIKLEKDNSTLKSQADSLKKTLEEEKARMEEVKNQMKQEFKIIANEILKNNSEEFKAKSKEDIDSLIKPLKEKIETFEKKVDETYEKGVKDQTELKAEMKKIYELSKQLDKDAQNLTKALKSDSKQQGNWGEVVLERILEESGLIKGQEYFIQESGKNIDGTTIRPDVIVRLPGKKYIIIDAKVSLTAYQEYVSSEDEDVKRIALKRHIESVKRHVKELSEKNYPSFEGMTTPDFVLMFMPVEPAFAAAIQADHNLFTYAWDRRVVIVSPTTLLATLRTIEAIWKQEKQTKNALEIARHAASLYDKFVGFLKDLEKVGVNIDRTKSAYDDAVKKLSQGRGNLVTQVEKLKDLGVKTQKTIDANLLEE